MALPKLWNEAISMEPIASPWKRGGVCSRTGDSALVEFRSAVDAVGCAVEIRNAMVERNAGGIRRASLTLRWSCTGHRAQDICRPAGRRARWWRRPHRSAQVPHLQLRRDAGEPRRHQGARRSEPGEPPREHKAWQPQMLAMQHKPQQPLPPQPGDSRV